MPAVSQKDITAALTELVREQLARGEEVVIPGLGRFGIQHRMSWIEQNEDGDFVMKPPQDQVSFTAE